jgi:hypothetical protein
MNNALPSSGAMEGMSCAWANTVTSGSDAGLPIGIVGLCYAAVALIQHEWKRCEVVQAKVASVFFDLASVWESTASAL